MKKVLLVITVAMLGFNTNVFAGDIIKLPQPDLDSASASFLQLLNNRQSGRSYDKDKRVDDVTLSEILWCARGINQYGKITVPTALNSQNLKVFVLKTNGIWLYNASENQLEKISDRNMLPYLAERQNFIMDAPVNLVYTSSDKVWGFAYAGSAYQNVYLYAQAKGLDTVIRGLANDKKMAAALNLEPNEFTIAHQPVGYSK